MQIVIDIDDDVYKRFMDDYVGCPDIIYAVRKGIPLPKGHGRLIDLNDLYDLDRRKVEYAPTIIEADKGE